MLFPVAKTNAILLSAATSASSKILIVTLFNAMFSSAPFSPTLACNSTKPLVTKEKVTTLPLYPSLISSVYDFANSL